MTRRTKAQAAAELERLAARRARMFTMWCEGMTQQAIGEHFGLHHSTVCTDLQIHRESLSAVDLETIRQDHIHQLQLLRASMYELTKLRGAPITAGKDGVVVKDPDDGAIVREYSGRINATRELRFLLERESKLLGLDAVSKTQLEHSGEVTFGGSVAEETARLEAELGLREPPEDPAGCADTGQTP